MDVWTRVKFALGGCTSVNKNVGAGSEEVDENIRMFDREWVAVIERIVRDRDAVVSNLVLIKERMREFVAEP
jgi:hypothetical protein